MEKKQYFEDMRMRIQDARINKTKIPYNKGEIYALCAYDETNRYESNRFECNCMPKDFNNLKSFTDVFKSVGIQEFAITESSTETIDVLHTLQTLGWSYNGLVTVRRNILNLGYQFVNAISIKYVGFDRYND